VKIVSKTLASKGWRKVVSDLLDNKSRKKEVIDLFRKCIPLYFKTVDQTKIKDKEITEKIKAGLKQCKQDMSTSRGRRSSHSIWGDVPDTDANTLFDSELTRQQVKDFGKELEHADSERAVSHKKARMKVYLTFVVKSLWRTYVG